MKRRSISLLLALVLALSLSAGAGAVDVSAPLEGTAAYILRTVPRPQVGSVGGEWAVLGLARSGVAVPQSYWADYYAAVETAVAACKGDLHATKYTEYSRVILALSAIGRDPRNVAGYDLTLPLGDQEKTCRQGINGPLWALLALDCRDYPMPQNPKAAVQATRQGYVDCILARQLPDGGWSLSGNAADPDLTGMVLQALAKYRSQSAVQSAVDRGLACLSALQDDRGGFSSWGAANLESTAQVVTALCTLGIDLQDSRFVKDGHTLLDDLLRYRQSDGSFRHALSGESSQMASEQALCALAAVHRVQTGQSPLYTMDALSVPAAPDPGFTPQDALALNVRLLENLDSSDPAALALMKRISNNAKALADFASRRVP